MINVKRAKTPYAYRRYQKVRFTINIETFGTLSKTYQPRKIDPYRSILSNPLPLQPISLTTPMSTKIKKCKSFAKKWRKRFKKKGTGNLDKCVLPAKPVFMYFKSNRKKNHYFKKKYEEDKQVYFKPNIISMMSSESQSKLEDLSVSRSKNGLQDQTRLLFPNLPNNRIRSWDRFQIQYRKGTNHTE